MQTVEEGMARVAAVAERVSVTELAREAGLPVSTVRSFRDRGWCLKSLPNCEKLIAAAERLEASERVAERIESAAAVELAREAGLPVDTARTYRDGGACLLTHRDREKLIAATERLERGTAASASQA
jgi:hypothetical protein